MDHPIIERIERTGYPHPVRNPHFPQQWLHEQRKPQKELTSTEFWNRR